jgi:hypothetical protein
MEINHFIIMLQDCCTAKTCPEMKADEWLFLCAAHPQPQGVTIILIVSYQCCAIDYSIHSLDGATALLNNNKYFPSRISIPESSSSYFQNISRRLYRIFAHSYFQHRDVFFEFENQYHVYERLLALSAKYSLIPAKALVIPSISKDSSNSNELPDSQ